MLREGSTMTMEAWGQAFKPNQDWNHAWGTAPANYIVRYLMGIRPVKPGFKEVAIKPHPAGLKKAAIKYNTIRGRIQVEFRQEADRFDMAVTIPGNTTATVFLPNLGNPHVKVTMDGKAVKTTDAHKITGYIRISDVTTGTHRFSVMAQSH